MATLVKYRRYGSFLRLLKTKLPAAYPVCVRRKSIHRHLEGRCWKHGRQFFIEIDHRLDENKAMDVLAHEWAHALAWNHRLDTARTDEAFNKLSHDAAWGVAYAEVYSLYDKHCTLSIL